ncbi:MAG TPA: hypothetical protein VKE74_28645 [Gemmataceae bacterium]|nr:hypothetical protein [Gemmataceae bacterium]
MKITLYVRTYPVKDAPVTLSLVPFPPGQRHTYTRDGKVYDAVSREMRVTVPDGSVIDEDRKLLCWVGDKGPVKSTVNEVYTFVQAHAPGFGTAS